jgi:hypothetical protein
LCIVCQQPDEKLETPVLQEGSVVELIISLSNQHIWFDFDF